MTTSETNLDELRARLQVWFTDRLGTPVRVENLARPTTSGMSSVSVLFDAAWHEGGTQRSAQLVARMAPDDSAVPVFPGYDFARQYEAMTGVRTHSDVPVPPVRWLETSAEPVGTPFLVMDRMSGAIPVDNPPYVFGGWLFDLAPAGRRELQDATVDTLARIHAIPQPATVFPTLAAGAGSDSLRAHVESERAYYDWSRKDDGLRIPLLDEAFAWLEGHWPAEPSPPVLCWGDARMGNVMYDGTRPVAVLDWESACLAPREVDLGWMICFHHMFQEIAGFFEMPGLPDMFRPSDVLARYELSSGVTPRDMNFYLVYAALRHGIVMSRIHRRRMHFGEVEAPQDPNEYVMHHALLRQLLDGTYEWENDT